MLPARNTAQRVMAVAALDNGNEYQTISVAQRTSNKNAQRHDNGLPRHCITTPHGLRRSEMLLDCWLNHLHRYTLSETGDHALQLALRVRWF